MYEIIHHDRIKSLLEQEFLKIRDNLQIISAYCTRNALEFVDSKIYNASVAKRLMVRFSLDDILNGATDFSIYEYCRQHNWSLFVQLNIHAKTFIFDKKRWVVGSANLTSKGIGLFDDSNLEMAVLADVNEVELQKINTMFDRATQMTDELYELMKNQITTAKIDGKSNAKWNKEILGLMNNEITTLFTQDFPKSKSLNNILLDDYLLLRLPSGTTDKSTIKDAFVSTIGFKWLVQVLAAAENNQLYFGAITAQLHNAIVNDPRPYRKEVKELLANLLAWIIELRVENIQIERPNYSQLITLLK
ncbi:MAG: phospholipase D-like domain-containing protein [Oscillospiraceae bacterium]|nr:phospholipase D-like domain-containing protein [Oscillospiraceae bacterium]